jgi:dipeptidyl aminopeptidase/acylaminoacyl peptidase
MREGIETSLVVLGADGRSRRTLLTVEGYLVAWDWSPDGRQAVVVTRSENARVGDVRLVDVENGGARVLWEEEHYAYVEPVAAFAPTVLPDSSARLVFRSNRSGWANLYTVRPDGDGVQPLTHGAWDDGSFRFSPDGQRLVFASLAGQEGTGDDLWTVPLSGGAPTRLTTHRGVNHPIGWTEGGDVLYWHADPTEPGDVWTVSVSDASSPADATPQPRRLTWSAPAELTRKVRPPEEVTFTSEGGTRVTALVYLPVDHQEGRQYPPIVWIRGGPTAFSRYTYSATPAWLANEGFLVITLNYRGSTGHGVPFMEAVAGEGVGKADLADVLAAAEHVKTLPQADLRRGVGVGGHSWGGYLTLMAVTNAPDTFSCGAAGAAISDWTVQQAQTEVRWYDRWLVGGWLYERDAHARDRSPITHAEKLKAPLLVLHGEQDADVPFAQIGPFVDRAKKSGAPVEFVTFANEGHGNRLPRNQQEYLDRIGAFFRRHLQQWNFRDNPTGSQVS